MIPHLYSIVKGRYDWEVAEANTYLWGEKVEYYELPVGREICLKIDGSALIVCEDGEETKRRLPETIREEVASWPTAGVVAWKIILIGPRQGTNPYQLPSPRVFCVGADLEDGPCTDFYARFNYLPVPPYVTTYFLWPAEDVKSTIKKDSVIALGCTSMGFLMVAGSNHSKMAKVDRTYV